MKTGIVLKGPAAGNESANAHPGPAVWVPTLVLFALSLAAYYVFWAKLTGAWPFAP